MGLFLLEHARDDRHGRPPLGKRCQALHRVDAPQVAFRDVEPRVPEPSETPLRGQTAS